MAFDGGAGAVLFGSALYAYCASLFMAHAAGFCAVSAFLYYCAKLGDGDRRQNTGLGLGGVLAAGLMVIVRQTNGLFLLAGFVSARVAANNAVRPKVVSSWSAALPWRGWPPRPSWHSNRCSGTGPSAIGSSISYGTEERFFWTRPELLNYLFSPMHGLVFSSPLMVLAALGLLLIVARQVRSAAAVRSPRLRVLGPVDLRELGVA